MVGAGPAPGPTPADLFSRATAFPRGPAAVRMGRPRRVPDGPSAGGGCSFSAFSLKLSALVPGVEGGWPMSVPSGPVWMVPRRRDPNFVGREEELAALEKALAAAGSSALTLPVAVHGLGGVGKTLLAVEFAHRHDADYTAVLWLAAEEPTALASAFADLARELRLPEAGEPDQNKQIAAVLRWLESPASGRWLLVFDNARRREGVEPYVPRRHTGHVLITSRNPDWQPLPRVRSIELLQKGLEGGNEDEADQLAHALGDLPLALAQAAAFVRETGRTSADYREMFNAQQD